MRQLIIALALILIVSVASVVEARVPRSAPPCNLDPVICNFLSSLRGHHNVLEHITSDPNGARNGAPGYHLWSTHDGAEHLCTATGQGPLTTTDWDCINISDATSTITVQRDDVDVDTSVNTLDFSTDFTVTSSPAGEANVSLNFNGVTGSGQAKQGTEYVPALWNTTTDLTFGGNNVLNLGPIFNIAGATSALSQENRFIIGWITWPSSIVAAPLTAAQQTHGYISSLQSKDTTGGGSSSQVGLDAANSTAINAGLAVNATGNFSTIGGGDHYFSSLRGLVFASDNYANTTASKGQMYGVLGLAEFDAAGFNANRAVGVFASSQVIAGTVDEAIGIEAFASGGTTLNCPIAITSQNPSLDPSLGFRTCIVSAATGTQTITLPDATGTFALTSSGDDLTIEKAVPTLTFSDSTNSTKIEMYLNADLMTFSDPDTANTETLQLDVANQIVHVPGQLNVTGNAAFHGEITSDKSDDIGWSVQTAANQACNTTCNRACVHGWETSAGEVAVDCSDATADKCLCAGSS